jgi:hypothetical protein
MELLFAFAVFYLAWLLIVGILRALCNILRTLVRLLLAPLLWLAHRQGQQARRRRQRARTMAGLRALARLRSAIGACNLLTVGRNVVNVGANIGLA